MTDRDWIGMYEFATGGLDPDGDDGTRHDRLSRKNEDGIESLVGTGPRATAGLSLDWYYGGLVAWAAKRCLVEQGWNVLAVFGYSHRQPLYRDIATDIEAHESCLVSGQMVVERDAARLIVTVDIGRRAPSDDVQVEGPETQQGTVKQLIQAIEEYCAGHNFYRSKIITMTYAGIEFVPAGPRAWDSVILDAAVKTMIRRNTVGFLRNLEAWPRYGIPTKRGIILAGGPGTGKTVICKALMTEAIGVTRLLSNAAGIIDTGYFSELYQVAQDLSPSIVFIEDLDSIGQERWGMYRGTPQLVSLLDEMDGINEKSRIVTVATTNQVETLDEALRQRPGRFDRVITIPPPSADLRAAHIELLSVKIPLDPEVKEYLVARTEGLSPAQVQVINRPDGDEATRSVAFTRADVDAVIAELKCRADRSVGFSAVNHRSRSDTLR
jgi:cell division protease FtsH